MQGLEGLRKGKDIMTKQVISTRTRVTLPGTAFKGATVRCKATPEAAIAEVRRAMRKQLDAARACLDAMDGAFCVEDIVVRDGKRPFRTKILQKGDRALRELRKFTVTLAFPAHLTDGHLETYCTDVYARDPKSAVEMTRAQCCADNGFSENERKNFRVITVFAGDSGGDLNPEWEFPEDQE